MNLTDSVQIDENLSQLQLCRTAAASMQRIQINARRRAPTATKSP